jgi:hypothetical protein
MIKQMIGIGIATTIAFGIGAIAVVGYIVAAVKA